MSEREPILEWFRYHQFTMAQQQRSDAVRLQAENMAAVLMAKCPPSADRTAAFRKLREAVWAANASIALGDPSSPPQDLGPLPGFHVSSEPTRTENVSQKTENVSTSEAFNAWLAELGKICLAGKEELQRLRYRHAVRAARLRRRLRTFKGDVAVLLRKAGEGLAPEQPAAKIGCSACEDRGWNEEEFEGMFGSYKIPCSDCQ